MNKLTGFVMLLCFVVSTSGSEPVSVHSRPQNSPLVWEAISAPVAPVIDGQVDEVWNTAKPLAVDVREAFGGADPKRVVLRALRSAETFYVLAQWPDRTKSDMRDPYVWNDETKTYDRPSRPDDQFALEFSLKGRFDTNMLATTHRFETDVWHWKAGRGNPVGWVDDKRHIISPDRMEQAVTYSLGGHATVHIARLMDEGRPAYQVKPKPTTFVGKIVDAFEQCQPSGSLADVRGKGVHNGKEWTLEMARKLNTGHSDDAVLDPDRDNPCAIAVLDDELYWRHSVSGIISLRFIRSKN